MDLNERSLTLLGSRISRAVEEIGLDLNGQRVLTEAATGPYVATPIIAAVAGADQVTACTRDTKWGRADDVLKMTVALAEHLGVKDKVLVSTRAPVELAKGAEIVTNLGMLRPISAELIAVLAPHAAIALMWEPWEFRPGDIDIEACFQHKIPVIATNEQHPAVNTFAAVGMLALKLLMEMQCEIAGLNIVVIGSDPFGTATAKTLRSVGARVSLVKDYEQLRRNRRVTLIEGADALVLVEHRSKTELLGSSTPELLDLLASSKIPVTHICGRVEDDALLRHGVLKHPAGSAPHGFMTVTTAHVGAKPVVNLHAAGLHAASLVSRERWRGASIDDAINRAVESGYGLRLEVAVT
jgi:hypothetical protein